MMFVWLDLSTIYNNDSKTVIQEQLVTLIPTSDWSSAEASPQLVLASGQGNGISGITEVCAPRPGSKKLHVCLQPIFPSPCKFSLFENE